MSAMRLAATAVKIAPQCNIRHTACGALAVSGRVEVKKSCAVGDVSSTSTVSQCRADDVAAAAAPSSVPDRDGTSPGIFGQTASPPPVPASGQKAGPSLEALARSAVAALIEETSKPADGQDAARLEALRKEAVCAARAYLKQVIHRIAKVWRTQLDWWVRRTERRSWGWHKGPTTLPSINIQFSSK